MSRDMMRASDKKLAYELVGKKLENKEDKPHNHKVQLWNMDLHYPYH